MTSTHPLGSNFELGNFEVGDSPELIAQRARAAMSLAQDRSQVLAATGLSSRTVNRILAGHRVKRGSLLDLAHALSVPAAWLLRGEGEFNPEWVNRKSVGQMTVKANDTVVGPLNIYPEPQPTAPEAPPRPASESSPTLFSIVDMDLLAGAIDAAREVLAARGAEPRGRSFAQIVCILYDEAAARLRGHDKR